MALNTNHTTSAGMSATALKTWYDRTLLENIKPKLVHYEYAQKRPIPRNGGKIVDFRKWTPFAAVTQPLSEGVVPEGQALSMTNLSATLESYGGYVAISDMVDMTSIDPVITDAVELMADQGGLSVDALIREELHRSTNVMYAGDAQRRSELLPENKLTMELVRKAVRTLKKAKAPRFSRGSREFYVAIVGPDTVFDLQSDSTWQAVAEYQDKEKIFSGEIGRVFGVVFVETTEAKLITAPALPQNLTVAAYDASSKVVTLSAALTPAQATALTQVGRIRIGTGFYNTDTVSGASLKLESVETAPTAGMQVVPCGPAADGSPLASTVVFGRNAYGCVDVEGNGNVHSLVKPAGSGGSADPLDQITTVGWKVAGFAAKVLQPGWLVRIEHGVTA
jgi:N4-gp56 family major capsid protein